MPACGLACCADHHIRQTLDMTRRADMLVFSVGAVSGHRDSTARIPDDLDLEYIQCHGAVGDICGAYFRQDGSPCSLELEERTVAASAEAMRAAPLRVGVGWGAAKALPSIGAIRAGLDQRPDHRGRVRPRNAGGPPPRTAQRTRRISHLFALVSQAISPSQLAPEAVGPCGQQRFARTRAQNSCDSCDPC